MISAALETVLVPGAPRGPGPPAPRAPHARAPALRGRPTTRRARRSCAPAASTSSGCAATWPATSTSAIERLPAGRRAGAGADARLPPRAAGDDSARAERGPRGGRRGRRPRRASCAAEALRGGQALDAQGVTRLDVLNYISHGVSQGPRRRHRPRDDGAAARRRTARRPGRPPTRSPPTRSTSPSGRAAGRSRPARRTPAPRSQRALEVLCRRRKNNPVFVGEAGVGKTALVEGLAQRLLAGRRARDPAGRRDLRARRRGAPRRHALSRRLRGAVQGPHRRARAAAEADPLRRRAAHDGRAPAPPAAAPWTSPTWSSRSSPRARSGSSARRPSRSSSTIEKDRALHRRLQKIAVDEPSVADAVQILKGLQLALRAAPRRRATPTRLSRRRCGSPAGTCASTGCPTARST